MVYGNGRWEYGCTSKDIRPAEAILAPAEHTYPFSFILRSHYEIYIDIYIPTYEAFVLE